MDRESFLLMREEIKKRMEERRASYVVTRVANPSRNGHDAMPMLISILKHLFFNYKKPFLKTIITAGGLGILGSLLPRQLAKLFTKSSDKHFSFFS